jgi:cytochrome P450
MTVISVPAHVPAGRVFDFDLYELEAEDGDFQAAYKRLNRPDVPDSIFWTPRNGGHWVVTRSQSIGEVLGNPDRFSSRTLSIPRPSVPEAPLMPLQADGDDHRKYRDLLAPALSPKAVQTLGEGARKLCIELIEGFRLRGECEFVGDFAQHLPIAIFMKIVDLPMSERDALTEEADLALRGGSAEIREAARRKMGAYALQKVVERRAKSGEDLISRLVHAKLDGKPLDDYTLTGMITLLLMAGLDTVAATLGFVARFMAQNPAHRQRLIEAPERIPDAVEELLRRFAVAVVAREVVSDCDLLGVRLKAGDMVLVPTGLDGLDEQRFDVPLTVDFERKRPIHSTFGAGLHRCMGSMLARMELKVFLEEWLRRIPAFTIKPGAQVTMMPSQVGALASLPLVWDPTMTR